MRVVCRNVNLLVVDRHFSPRDECLIVSLHHLFDVTFALLPQREVLLCLSFRGIICTRLYLHTSLLVHTQTFSACAHIANKIKHAIHPEIPTWGRKMGPQAYLPLAGSSTPASCFIIRRKYASGSANKRPAPSPEAASQPQPPRCAILSRISIPSLTIYHKWLHFVIGVGRGKE